MQGIFGKNIKNLINYTKIEIICFTIKFVYDNIILIKQRKIIIFKTLVIHVILYNLDLK